MRLRQEAAQLSITNLCMARTPLTSNSCLSEKFVRAEAAGETQKTFTVLYTRRMHEISAIKPEFFTRKKGRPLPISPGCKEHAAVLRFSKARRPARSRVQRSEALTPRKQDSLSCPKHRPGQLRSRQCKPAAAELR